MTTGFNYETMEWKSYEDFFYSFLDETTSNNRDKAFAHLTGSRLNTAPTFQEITFITTMVKTHSKPHGEEIDSDCNRFGCFGTIRTKADSDMSCSCHNFAPCSKCTAGTYCPDCDWDSDEDN
jgi:hypothetical protein